MEHMNKIIPYTTDRYMVIDSSSRRNLELVETLREKQKRGSLLWVLDKTKTAMGARMLAKLCGTAIDRCRCDQRTTGCGNGTEHAGDASRGDPGIPESGI